MNRIILIGNGFDLAHNMKTSYNNFINDYWEKIMLRLRNEVNGNITTRRNTFETQEIKIEDVPGGPYAYGEWVIGSSHDDLIDILSRKNLNLIFKNRFLEILTKKQKDKNWVDIENEYYDLLKISFRDENCAYKIKELNEDLDQIKNLLEIYLKSVEDEFSADFGNKTNEVILKKNIGRKIYSPFRLRDFTETSINKKTEIEFQKIQKDLKAIKEDLVDMSELSEKSQKLIAALGSDAPFKDIRKLLLSDTAVNYFELMPEEILFLSFNYTFTEDLYSDQNQFYSSASGKNVPKSIIHIHGTTDEGDSNPIIF